MFLTENVEFKHVLMNMYFQASFEEISGTKQYF